MAINVTAFAKTAQAKDDVYGCAEVALLGSGLLRGIGVTLPCWSATGAATPGRRLVYSAPKRLLRCDLARPVLHHYAR